MVIKTVGASLALGGAATGVGTARSGSKTNYKFKLRGTKDNPVSTEQVNERRKDVFTTFNKETDGGSSGALVGLENKDDILAYNFVASGDNGVQEHIYTADLSDKRITVADDPEGRGTSTSEVVVSPTGDKTVRRAHTAADEWFETESPGGAAQDDYTATNQPDFSTWLDRQDLYHTNEKPPYGIIIEDYTLKESPNQDDVFGLRTGVDIEAGENQAQYGDDDYKVPSHDHGAYQNKNCMVKHDWNTVISESDSMRDRAPRGGLSDGTQSYGISLGVDGGGTGSIGFSYGYSSKSDKIVDESSQSDNVGRWKLKVGSRSKASDNNMYYNPGSLAILHPENNEGCDLYPWQDMKVADMPLNATFALTSAFDAVWTLYTDESVSLSEDFYLPCP